MRVGITLTALFLLTLGLACGGLQPDGQPGNEILDGLLVSGDRSVDRGIELYEAGEYRAAAEAFSEAIEQGVSSYELAVVYTCLGNAYNELEDRDRAVTAHEKALELDPTLHEAWVNLGVVHRLRGDFDSAEAAYGKALELAPDYAELHASLGSLYIHQEKYAQALVHLEQAVELDGTLPVAWGNLALGYATVGRFEEARSTLKKAVVIGYHNGPLIQERIDALEAVSN
jgi:tetratricopeptide (TPR) repeat protein